MFKKIDENSESSLHAGFSLFGVPATNTSVEKSFYREIHTAEPISQSGSHSFIIKSDTAWIDLSKSYLYLEIALRKKNDKGDWVHLATDDQGSVIQGIAKTMFRDIKVSLNGTEISSDNSLYAYKAYFETELMYSKDVKATRLITAGYNTYDIANLMGRDSRNNLFTTQNTVQFLTNLHIDLATSDKFLLNNSELILKFFRNSDEFCIHSPETDSNEYSIELIDMRLYVKTLIAYSGLNVSLLNTLNKTPGKYALRHAAMQSLYISPGRYEFGPEIIFPDRIPRKIIIGMVDRDAFNGNKHLNPFIFKHNNLREISVNAGGLVYPVVPYNLQFPERCIKAYHDLFVSMDFPSDKTNGISFQNFLNSHCFFSVNLTSTHDDSSDLELIKAGSTSLHLKFNSPIKDNGIEVIIYGDWDSVLSIDASRSVLVDGKSG